jgi:sarcosine oxidase subunit alpha
VIDDGIVQRLSETSFVLNSSSAHAGMITDWLEQWSQCEWPNLDVSIDDLTSQWACFTVAGPMARKVLQSLDVEADLSRQSLPHLSIVQTHVAGWPARIARVSFSGELSFELSVPAGHGPAMLRAIGQAVTEEGGCPYGIEALMTLRLEKGYFHVGTDTDGTSCPDDVGWSGTARNKARDYIGRRSLERPANREPGRRQLVGLEPVDRGERLTIGGHFSEGPGHGSDGWISSACFSPTLQRWIGLGLLRDGRNRLGEQVPVYDEGEHYAVRVVSPAFHDPQGARLDG